MDAAQRALLKGEDMTEQAEELEEVAEDIMSLSDTFNDDLEDAEDKSEETSEVETGETEEVEETEAKAEEETTETEVVTPTTEQSGLYAALQAERKKRQEAEERLAKKEPEVVPDPMDDPEGYAKHIEQKADKGLLETRISLSRDLMMDSKDDYLEKEKVFMGMIMDDEGKVIDKTLHEKFLASSNPAKFTYDTAKEHLEIQELKSPDYRDKLKAEIRAELLAEMKVPEIKSVKPTEVPNLTKASEAGSNTEKAESEITEMSELFG